jgi:hypothetical protein
MVTSTFNFHGLVGFSLDCQAEYAHNFFRSEYGWAGDDQLPDSRIMLRWTHSAAPIFQPGAGVYHQHKLAARWRYRLSIQPNLIEIEATGNALALTMVHHMLVHPSLRLLASQQGVILLHGAGLVLDGRSLVFSGIGGTGKTTTTSLLLDQGRFDWRLHADDYTFITEQAQSLAYLTRAHLYRDLLAWVPDLGDRLGSSQKFKLIVNNLMLKASGGRLRWAVRVPLGTLWPDRAKQTEAGLAGLIMLRRSANQEPKLSRVTDQARLHDELTAMNNYEARHFIRLLRKSLPGATAEPILQSWQERESRILTTILATAPSYWLELPVFPAGDKSTGSRIEAALGEAFEGKMK